MHGNLCSQFFGLVFTLFSFNLWPLLIVLVFFNRAIILAIAVESATIGFHPQAPLRITRRERRANASDAPNS